MSVYEEDLPEEKVKINISRCPKCDEAVTVIVSHVKDKKNFYKEVQKLNLNIQTVTLFEYRNMNINFCDCNECKCIK